MPPVTNSFNQTLSNNCQILADKWSEINQDSTIGAPSIDYLFKDFNANQKTLFLEKLCSRGKFEKKVLEMLDETCGFSSNNNAEIKCKWLILCLNASHEAYYEQAAKFVTKVGRMKFVRPTFRALFAAEGGKELAVETFKAHKSFYHPICATMVARDLNLA